MTPTFQIALLRGVNVGGHKKVAMADLRAFAIDLGLGDARTLLQSGNLVFSSSGKSGAALERWLETEAEKRLGLKTEFHVRTATEWATVVAGNPFPDEAKRDPGHLIVFAFKDTLAAAAVKALQAAITGREVVRASGRHAYVVYPDGAGKSRLTPALMDRKLGARGTGRNWNTVLKLAAITSS